VKNVVRTEPCGSPPGIARFPLTLQRRACQSSTAGTQTIGSPNDGIKKTDLPWLRHEPDQSGLKHLPDRSPEMHAAQFSKTARPGLLGPERLLHARTGLRPFRRAHKYTLPGTVCPAPGKNFFPSPEGERIAACRAAKSCPRAPGEDTRTARGRPARHRS